MTSNERQSAVRSINHLHDKYPADSLNFTIDEVMRYMVDSGVPKDVVESSAALCCIASGVDDLMRPEKTYSQHFKDCICHLSAYESQEVE